MHGWLGWQPDRLGRRASRAVEAVSHGQQPWKKFTLSRSACWACLAVVTVVQARPSWVAVMAAVTQTICGSAYLDVITLRLVAVMAEVHAGQLWQWQYPIRPSWQKCMLGSRASLIFMAEVHSGQSWQKYMQGSCGSGSAQYDSHGRSACWAVVQFDIHGRSAFWAVVQV